MKPAVLKATINILTTEANELAGLLDKNAFENMHHRVNIAVRTEMDRLRELASELRRELPPEDPT